jgi:CheY-like chemotaxis protein
LRCPLRVEEARDGLEGLHKARERSPDIILTDLAMPYMDGWEMIGRLKNDERTRRIPIIACSGEDSPLARRHLAADVILPKPCAPDLLLVETRRLLLPRGA